VTLASDQKLDPDKLSATSRRMLELRNAALSEWEKRVRASVRQADALSRPILINTLPTLYDNIAESLTPNYPRENAVATTTIAAEHGGERARLTNYDLQSVIREYQLLKSTLLDVLKQNGIQLRDDELLVIDTSFDTAIREAVTAFALALTALREKFVASLAHDLRNPLAVANMAADLIANTTDSSRTKDLADRIIRNHDRMDQMIQDLLDTMVFQSDKRLRLDLSNFDILDVAKEVCDQFTSIYQPRFQIIGRSVKGWWGRDPMKRALENLVGNAVKYGAPDKQIRIKIDEMHERLLLSVHNEGNPIPPEELEDIFQFFQRSLAAKESKKQGWGIGLSYVREVAESHGGSIGVDSSAERGTTFLIDIPVDARPYQNAPTLGGTD
jgi:signal transduction histidine kinase